MPQRHQLANTTPFPNFLLDQVMPALKDTEWRLLCVIVRQTLGWQEKTQMERRKGRDWLTHSQLKARTGRNSEAICQAIDTLVRHQLVVVWRIDGVALTTAQARRHWGSHLFFGLSPQLRERLDLRPQSKHHRAASTFSKSENNKRNSDKNI